METLSISVVIPVYNGAETIDVCLHSLLNQTRPPSEVIIVDNGSSDKTLEKIEAFAKKHKECNVILSHEKERGPSACRNHGVKISKGEIVCFTDSDCVVDTHWIRDIEETFRSSEVGAVAGNLYGYQPENIIEQFLSLYTLRGLPEDQTFNCYTLSQGGFATANLSVLREVFEEIGGFDREMRYGEDHNLCARIMDAGYKLKYIHNGIVRHIHRSRFRGFVRQSFFTGIGHAHLLRKYRNGVLLIDWIGKKYHREHFPGRLWIGAQSADKKLFLLTTVWVFVSWGWLLPLLYGFYLINSVSRKAKDSEIESNILKLVIWTGLLVIKSFSITLGRWIGSFQFKVLCL